MPFFFFFFFYVTAVVGGVGEDEVFNVRGREWEEELSVAGIKEEKDSFLEIMDIGDKREGEKKK